MLSVTIEQGAKVRTEDCQAQNKTVLNLSGIIDNMTAAVVQGHHGRVVTPSNKLSGVASTRPIINTLTHSRATAETPPATSN